MERDGNMPRPKRNGDGEFITIAEATRKLNLCRSSVVRLAEQSDSLYRYGKSIRIHWDSLQKFFMENYKNNSCSNEVKEVQQ